MHISAIETRALAREVHFTQEDLVVFLVDGRKVSVPLAWFPRLANASGGQLENYQLMGDGEGIHWPEIDEDISVNGLLRGNR